MGFASSHQDLDVYRQAFRLAVQMQEISRQWPERERYALQDQIVRSSRSVCSNLAEAWGRRAYTRSFRAKIVDALSESHETLTWIEFAEAFGFLSSATSTELSENYRHVIARLLHMHKNAPSWCFDHPRR